MPGRRSSRSHCRNRIISQKLRQPPNKNTASCKRRRKDIRRCAAPPAAGGRPAEPPARLTAGFACRAARRSALYPSYALPIVPLNKIASPALKGLKIFRSCKIMPRFLPILPGLSSPGSKASLRAQKPDTQLCFPLIAYAPSTEQYGNGPTRIQDPLLR